MLWFATTTLEKLPAVPPRFWANVLLAAATVVVVAVMVRYAAQMNKLVLGLIVFLPLSVVSFQWV